VNSLSASLTMPFSATIPAGSNYVDIQIKGQTVSTDSLVTITVNATGYRSDTETITVRDSGTTQQVGESKPFYASTSLGGNWHEADFGDASGGSSSLGNGVVTVNGRGTRTDATDNSLVRYNGRHFVWKTISGTTQEIIAKVDSTSSADQVGIMLSDDAAPLTEYIFLTNKKQVFTSSNLSTHDGTVQGNAAGSTTVPWLRLTRSSNILTAYTATTSGVPTSADWTQLYTINLNAVPDAAAPDYKSAAAWDSQICVGLFVNSNSTTTLGTANFSNISIFGDDLTTPTAVTNTGISIATGSTGNIVSTPMLQYSDDVSITDSILYTLSTSPLKGLLRRNGIILRAGNFLTQADIDNGRITYDDVLHANETLSFIVQDAAGNTVNDTLTVSVI
jgi:hypothetical protein